MAIPAANLAGMSGERLTGAKVISYRTWPENGTTKFQSSSILPILNLNESSTRLIQPKTLASRKSSHFEASTIGHASCIILASRSDSNFKEKYNVELLLVEKVRNDASSPPKKIIIASPTDAGKYPVLLFIHGFVLPIDSYKQILEEISSDGFIVVAAQLYTYLPQSTTEDVKSAAAVTDWLPVGLPDLVPKGIEPDFEKLAIGGHSRGGHTAFALALGHAAKTSLKFSAVIGFDPVAGTSESSPQVKPEILTYKPASFELKGSPVLIIGSGLGEEGLLPFMPPCTPKGLNHKQFLYECKPPRYHFELVGAGHLDILDDDAPFFTRCICKNGKCRAAVRRATAVLTTAFLEAHLKDKPESLIEIHSFYDMKNV